MAIENNIQIENTGFVAKYSRVDAVTIGSNGDAVIILGMFPSKTAAADGKEPISKKIPIKAAIGGKQLKELFKALEKKIVAEGDKG